MKSLLISLTFGLAATTACCLRVDVGAPLPDTAAVPPDFVGFSVEIYNALDALGRNGTRASYAQLLRNLHVLSSGIPGAPPPTLRFGGNSADTSCFVAAEANPSPKGCSYLIRDADLAAYASFAALAPVKYCLGINFGLTPDPHTVAVGHVQAIGRHGLWDAIHTIEVGNEVDLYAVHAAANKSHFRLPSWTPHDYLHEFGAFLDAFQAAGDVPETRNIVQGATWATSPQEQSWAAAWTPFLTQFASRIKSVSYHKYGMHRCGTWPDPTVAGILAAPAAAGAVGQLEPFLEAAKAQDVPFVIGEGNSASCGGQTNVSDAFAAALWVVDFLSMAAKAGATGMLFHGFQDAYSPIAYYPYANGTRTRLEVRPLYSGLLAFATLTANASVWLEATVSRLDDETPTSVCADGVWRVGSDEDIGVCCAVECVTCGGAGCDKLAGGAAACCEDSIRAAGKSCNRGSSAAPPCTLDDDRDKIVAHATRDSATGAVRVMLVNKEHRISASAAAGSVSNAVKVCMLEATRATTAVVRRLLAPGNDAQAKRNITWQGQNFDNTTTGLPKGVAREEIITVDPSSGCFAVALPPSSAALLELT